MASMSRRLLLTSSCRRIKRVKQHHQEFNDNKTIVPDTNMAKTRSLQSNGHHVKGQGQASTRSTTTKSKHSIPKSKPVKDQRYNSTIWLIFISLFFLILSVILFEYRHWIGFQIWRKNDSVRENTTFVKPVTEGGWRLSDDLTNSLYDSRICNIDRLLADDISTSDFEKNYRLKKPVIVKFRNGASDWTNPVKWTVDSLNQEYGDWSVLSGNAREIVRRGGSGYVDTSFSEYVQEMIRSNDSLGEPLYVFDREFYKDSSLPNTLHLPKYLAVKDDLDDSIFFLGSSGSGVSFHKHADAWNGVVYGRKRWFLYPEHHTPPGGVYPGYTQTEWYRKIYPKLSEIDKPLECIQEPGEILYLPEGMYHGTINLGDTIAIGIQKKEAQTEVEQLFYEENKVVGKIRSAKNAKQKTKLLQRKKDIYISLLKLLPDNSEVLLKTGQMYNEIGDKQKALFYTQGAIELDQHFIVAVISMGELQAELGHPEEAEKYFKQALEMNPKLWDCYARYGDFLLNHDRPADAVNILRQGTILEPNMLPFWTRLRLAQELAGDQDGARETQETIDKMQTR